ncbi:MAG: hypothetical protein LBR53_08060 [Deltaproteobacteria bacterium]|jgi:hypothetical protein|nr:hypothetical protein [Deltaproteobacteria bacterium]
MKTTARAHGERAFDKSPGKKTNMEADALKTAPPTDFLASGRAFHLHRLTPPGIQRPAGGPRRRLRPARERSLRLAGRRAIPFAGSLTSAAFSLKSMKKTYLLFSQPAPSSLERMFSPFNTRMNISVFPRFAAVFGFTLPRRGEAVSRETTRSGPIRKIFLKKYRSKQRKNASAFSFSIKKHPRLIRIPCHVFSETDMWLKRQGGDPEDELNAQS